MKFIDLENQRFERLVALEYLSDCKWLCQCDCGSKHIVSGSNLTSGHTKSCGCLRKELGAKSKTTHGMSHLPEYSIWLDMKKRCYNEKSISYHNYGARGIYVCDRWINDFENFYSDMGQRPSDKHSIERNDYNGNYTPENCRWATRTEQNRNTRKNKFLTYNGETLTIAEWAERTGLNPNLICIRIRRGWSDEKALNTPPRELSRKTNAYNKRYLAYDGKTLSCTEWSQVTGIPLNTVLGRLDRLNWSIEKTLSTPVRKMNRRK